MQYERLKRQTWDEFERERQGKKIFLFGCGKGVEYFFQHYGYDIRIEGVVDNDLCKQKSPVSSYVYENIADLCRFPLVQSWEILKEYWDEQVVFVISSLRYYVEIGKQLSSLGFRHYFSLYFMKENEKGTMDFQAAADEFIEECCRLPLNPKKMVFYTMGGYSGHGKRIAQLLLEKRRDLDIVWLIRRPQPDIPEGIRTVRYDNRKKMIYEMETAGYWIFDDNIAEPLRKRERQCYIQVKHWGPVTLKTFGRDLGEFRQKNCGELEDAIWSRNSEMMDYVFVGSSFDERTFRKAFAYEGKAVYVGSPRSDLLFQGETLKKKVYGMYNLDEQVRILLYAPTFRIQKTISGYRQEYLDTDLDLDRLYKTVKQRFGGEWMIFLRLHPNVAFRSKEIKKPPFVLDVSDYGDGEELAAVSALMVTDYSSIMFEPAFVKKPVFLYAPDRYEYIDQERKLLIDYDALPFDIAGSNDELCKKIMEFDPVRYEDGLDCFFRQYGVSEDGKAGERAVDFIMKLLEENVE